MWIKSSNLERPRGLTRDGIFAAFSADLMPIAVLNKRNRQLLGVESKNLLCSEAYFIDHAVNHHPEMPPEEFLKIQATLDAPDEVVEDAKSETIGFIKAVGSKKRILFIKKDSESLVFYRTLYLQRGRLSQRYKKISLAELQGFADRERACLDMIKPQKRHARTCNEVLSGRLRYATPPEARIFLVLSAKIV